MKQLITFNLLALMMLFTGCVSTAKDKMNDPEWIVCPEQRPEICTMQYDPVCAKIKDGLNKTYSTGCTACSDHGVVGYRPGECK